MDCRHEKEDAFICPWVEKGRRSRKAYTTFGSTQKSASHDLTALIGVYAILPLCYWHHGTLCMSYSRAQVG